MGRSVHKREAEGPLKGDTRGERIKDARLRKGWTQQQLADAVGVSQPAIGLWERGKRDILADNLMALAKALGVSVEELAGMLDDQEPDFVAWRAFIATPEGQNASERELASLKSFAWPEGTKPTVHSYRLLLLAAQTAVDAAPSAPASAAEEPPTGTRRINRPKEK